MKSSAFNSFIHILGKHTLIFNSFTGIFIVVRNKLLDKSILNEDKSNLTDSFYDQLTKAGALVDDNVDEIDLLEKSIKNVDTNDNQYILHINPTLDCNFCCWYCYENHIANSVMTPAIFNRVIKLIEKIIHVESIENFELGFFGGEPMLCFGNIIKPIMTKTDELCKDYNTKLHIHFTTNGSILSDEMLNFLKQFDCGFQITLDGGKQCHDKTRFFKGGRGSYSIILDNIKKIVACKLNTIVRVNYTTANINSVSQILEEFESVSNELRSLISFDFQRVWQDRLNVFDKTEEIAQNFRVECADLGFKVLSNHIANNVLNSCYGDKKNHCLINYDGSVFGCTARDFNLQNTIGFIDESGDIQFRNSALIRDKAKFSKQICRTCRIAPLCGGGCKQLAYENLNKDGCVFDYTEYEKDEIILKIFENSAMKYSTVISD